MKGDIGFDFDGTLTRCPYAFAGIINGGNNSGLRAYLITGRPESERERTMRELLAIGIDPDYFEEMIFFPKQYSLPEFSHEVLAMVSVWKAEICRKMELDMLFEDSTLTVAEVKRISPNTIISLII